MNRDSFVNRNVVNLFEYIIAALMILNCASVWSTDYITGFTFANIVVVLCFFSMIVVVIFSKEFFTKLSLRLYMSLICIVIYIGMHILLYHSALRESVVFLLSILIFYLFVYFKGKDGIKRLLHKYKQLILLLAVVSLFFWVFGSILKIIDSTDQIISIWQGEENGLAVFPSFWGLYFETQTVTIFDSESLVRNTGIFAEAPMYSFHLSLALIIEFFIDRKSWINAVIIIICIGTTISSTGYVLVMLILSYIFIINTSGKGAYLLLKRAGVPILLFIVGAAVMYVFSDKSDSWSAIIRADDYIVGFETWMASPIFGYGIGNFDALKQNMGSWRSFNTGYSNGVFAVLSQGGLYIGIFYIYAFAIGIISSLRQKKYDLFFISCLLLYLFIFTVIPYQLIFICFMYYLALGNRKYIGKS